MSENQDEILTQADADKPGSGPRPRMSVDLWAVALALAAALLVRFDLIRNVKW